MDGFEERYDMICLMCKDNEDCHIENVNERDVNAVSMHVHRCRLSFYDR